MLVKGCVAVLAAAIVLIGVPAGARAGNDRPPARCNLRISGDIEAQVRAIMAPRNGMQAENRAAALQQQLRSLASERTILDAACDTDEQRVPVMGHVDAVEASIFSEQAALAVQIFQAKCPGAALKIASGFLAAGWAALAQIQTLAATPAPDPLRTDVTNDITAASQLYSLTLPPLDQATPYWRDTVQQTAKTAMESCSQR